MASPNYLKLVTTGEKNLTPENIVRFSKALELDSHESDYFEALVLFNQARESLQKQFYQDRLTRLKARMGGEVGKTLEEFEFEVMSSWLHHVLMVMTNIKGFLLSPPWIKRQLFDQANEEEIRRIYDQLFAMGLLKKEDNGVVKQTYKQVKTKPVMRRLSAKLFHEGILKRAIEGLHIGKPEDREYTSLLVGISEDQLPEIKKRIREFVKDLNDLALENPEPDQIYSFSVAAFPMSKPGREDG